MKNINEKYYIKFDDFIIRNANTSVEFKECPSDGGRLLDMIDEWTSISTGILFGLTTIISL